MSKKCASSEQEFVDNSNQNIDYQLSGVQNNSQQKNVQFGIKQQCMNDEIQDVTVAYAVNIYNNLRPHASINYLTPQQAHTWQGQIPARWKSRKQRVKECLYIELNE